MGQRLRVWWIPGVSFVSGNVQAWNERNLDAGAWCGLFRGAISPGADRPIINIWNIDSAFLILETSGTPGAGIGSNLSPNNERSAKYSRNNRPGRRYRPYDHFSGGQVAGSGMERDGRRASAFKRKAYRRRPYFPARIENKSKSPNDYEISDPIDRV